MKEAFAFALAAGIKPHAKCEYSTITVFDSSDGGDSSVHRSWPVAMAVCFQPHQSIGEADAKMMFRSLASGEYAVACGYYFECVDEHEKKGGGR